MIKSQTLSGFFTLETRPEWRLLHWQRDVLEHRFYFII